MGLHETSFSFKITCKHWRNIRGTQRQLSENICSEDDLRSSIFGTFVIKFLACRPLGFSNIQKMHGVIAHF